MNVYVWFSLGVIAALSGIVLWFVLNPFECLKNEQAVLIEVGLAILLTLGFYLLQNKNNLRRKQFWANVAYSQLHAIMNDHSMARETFRQLIKEKMQKSDVEDAIKNLEDYCTNAVKWYIPKLDKAMTQIADLLDDPSLFYNITDNEYSQFKILFTEVGGYLTSSDQVTHEIEVLDARITTIQDYMRRLEKEKPSIRE